MKTELISCGLMAIGTLSVLRWLLGDLLQKLKSLLILLAKLKRWWRTEFRSLL